MTRPGTPSSKVVCLPSCQPKGSQCSLSQPSGGSVLGLLGGTLDRLSWLNGSPKVPV